MLIIHYVIKNVSKTILLINLFSYSNRSIPAHVPVIPGDRLHVLYGPTPKESKVTYEAKVKH